MTTIRTVEFGVGNITNTRYFLGDMSKEGKDALIQINKARKQWGKHHTAAQSALSPADVPLTTGSQSRYRAGATYNSDISNRNKLATHDTAHVLPMAIKGKGAGLGPNNVGEIMTKQIEHNVYHTNKPVPIGDLISPETRPFKYRNVMSDELALAPSTGNEPRISRNSKGRLLPQRNVEARLKYVQRVMDDIHGTPGMKEAISAGKYLDSRAYKLNAPKPRDLGNEYLY